MTKNKSNKNLIPALCQSALHLAARHAWSKLSLEHIAKHARIPMAEATKILADRDALIPHLVQQVDDQLIALFNKSKPEGSVRERLFEILMARFDILQENRAGYISIARATRDTPRLGIKLATALYTSMQNTQEIAGEKASPLHTAALVLLYGATHAVWQKDTSSDMTKTMAALDKNLSRAEKVVLQGEKFLRCRR